MTCGVSEQAQVSSVKAADPLKRLFSLVEILGDAEQSFVIVLETDGASEARREPVFRWNVVGVRIPKPRRWARLDHGTAVVRVDRARWLQRLSHLRQATQLRHEFVAQSSQPVDGLDSVVNSRVKPTVLGKSKPGNRFISCNA